MFIKLSFSFLKNNNIVLSIGSDHLDTCFFTANLNSSFTPLPAPLVDILGLQILKVEQKKKKKAFEYQK